MRSTELFMSLTVYDEAKLEQRITLIFVSNRFQW